MPDEVRIIARIYNDYTEKFGVPRQPGRVEMVSKIVFEKEYRDPNAFRGITDFSHLWLIWKFSESVREGFSPTVRPPRLGGNARLGVFATRSPFRPNPIGLSAVALLELSFTKEEGPVLYVAGADLMNGSPIYDSKPYLPYADAIEGARGGFTDALSEEPLSVVFEEGARGILPIEREKVLIQILEQDPRPRYLKTPGRVYGLSFGGNNVRFSVAGRTLTVLEITDGSSREENSR